MHVDETLHLGTAAGAEFTQTWIQIDEVKVYYNRFKPLTISLSFIYDLFGNSLFAAQLLSLTSGIISLLFIFLIGRRISPRIGILASLLWAISPMAISINLYIRDYTFGIMWQLFVVWLVIEAAHRHKSQIDKLLKLKIDNPKNYISLQSFTAIISLLLSISYYFYDHLSTINSIVFIFSAFVAFAISVFTTNYLGAGRNYLPIISSLVAILGVSTVGLIGEIRGIVSISLPKLDQQFFDYMLFNPGYFELNILFPFIPLALVAALFAKPKLKKSSAIYSYNLVVTITISLFFFYAFVMERVFLPRYTVYLTPWLLITLAAFFIFTYDHFQTFSKDTKLRVVLIVISSFLFFAIPQGSWEQFNNHNLDYKFNERFHRLNDVNAPNESLVNYDFNAIDTQLEEIDYQEELEPIISSAPRATVYFSDRVSSRNNKLYSFKYWKAENFEKIYDLSKSYENGVISMMAIHNLENPWPEQMPHENFYINDLEICYLSSQSRMDLYAWGNRCKTSND
ncbi:MAG: glycosyltransferase family 39 protein [Candidatus Dojkabacteria bacterium]